MFYSHQKRCGIFQSQCLQLDSYLCEPGLALVRVGFCCCLQVWEKRKFAKAYLRPEQARKAAGPYVKSECILCQEKFVWYWWRICCFLYWNGDSCHRTADVCPARVHYLPCSRVLSTVLCCTWDQGTPGAMLPHCRLALKSLFCNLADMTLSLKIERKYWRHRGFDCLYDCFILVSDVTE